MGSDERLNDLLLRWDELREQGQEVSADQLCKDCPELAEEVRRAIEALQAMYRVPNEPLATAASRPGDRERTARPTVPDVVGYEILGELGRGGMGVVYRARHARLKRDVALKMIRAGAHAGTHELTRFRTEAEAVARLQHPNIVQIYEIAEQDGCPYLALEFVDGPSLAEKLRDGPLPARLAADMTRILARAVHYAHERGIVHRDLKPANVLLQRAGFVVQDSAQAAARYSSPNSEPGRLYPKIADFGLAKLIDAEVNQTHTGAVMGSPSYMAPEQAHGRTRDVGPVTDVYALGAILYEMLTGRPPFAAATLLETLDQVRSQEPVPPIRLNRHLPRDLETICLKCLEKEPSRRYPCAQAVADDLDRFLSGELISARSFRLADRLARTLTSTPGRFRFRKLSTTLLVLSPMPLLTNLLVCVLILMQSDYVSASIAANLVAAPASVAIIFLNSRWRTQLPMSPVERQFWSIWIGVPASLAILFFVYHRPATPEQPLPDLWLYPAIAVVHGLAFLVMGSAFWGGTYVAGVSFFAVALVMPLHLEWAPLEFGLLMSTTLVALSRHLRSGRDDAAV